MTLQHTALIILAVLMPQLALAQQNKTHTSEEQQWEKWFEGDFEEQALQVNEGKLEFLHQPPAHKAVHTVTNTITISDSSLKTQWVTLHQCHKNLDPVAQSEIVYRYKDMRNLRLEHYFGMDKAWIENQSVQMKDIDRGASLCILADVKIFRPVENGHYTLRNGPYFRKFLDGYYPFHVKLNIHYPKSALRLETTSPEAQSGFDVREDNGTLKMDAWFEGELMVEARFSPALVD
ncbi:MAG: hypothetical protein PVG89_07755 [Gammaproteobacteria bacterium]|jgi:hypothetical protein